ncbi:MAG: polyprenyl synthetase family protein [Oscillospiraceae bacterium]|jgi:geranylgeranyl diphosphate synthase type II|nr:polyprenyl synthetase family protein [Oscillospiraceae bacterium]
MNSFRAEYGRLRAMIEDRLASYFAATGKDAGGGVPSALSDAMRYSLAAGGKRVRPVLTLLFCLACGGDEATALDAACGVECLHTYSLIHDDLPAMDDDELRRGKPSNHIVFGEWRAILAGDALQAKAFELVAASPLQPERVVKMLRELARAAGELGICGGQALDMEAEERGADADGLYKIHAMKTSSLMEAAAKLGVFSAGGSDIQLRAAGEYARAVGMAFQIRDDALDATADSATLGKPAGSDEKRGKTTFFTLFGRARCEELIAGETERAKAALRPAFENAGALSGLADDLARRGK